MTKQCLDHMQNYTTLTHGDTHFSQKIHQWLRIKTDMVADSSAWFSFVMHDVEICISLLQMFTIYSLTTAWRKLYITQSQLVG